MNFCVAILILKMEEKKQRFWHSTLYYFKKGKNTTETQKKKKKRYAQCMEKVLWLIEHVKSGLQSFLLEISCRMMLHGQVDQLKLIVIKSKKIIEDNQRYTMWEIADILKISKSSAENHLHPLGYVNRFDAWVPHKLREKNLLDCISACDSLLKHNENVPFLKQIVTSDEKWILYNNVEWKRSWGKWNEPPPTTLKAGLHPKKVMLCIWWD